VLDFYAVRFMLFTHSYVGHHLKKVINLTENKKPRIERFSQILVFNSSQLKCFVLHKSCIHNFSIRQLRRVSDYEKLSVYLKVEKELLFLIGERQKKEHEIPDDYERAVLTPAIERVTGNTLAKITNDGEFEAKLATLRNLYTYYYYLVTCRYRLPTLRILPFLVRLLLFENENFPV